MNARNRNAAKTIYLMSGSLSSAGRVSLPCMGDIPSRYSSKVPKGHTQPQNNLQKSSAMNMKIPRLISPINQLLLKILIWLILLAAVFYSCLKLLKHLIINVILVE